MRDTFVNSMVVSLHQIASNQGFSTWKRLTMVSGFFTTGMRNMGDATTDTIRYYDEQADAFTRDTAQARVTEIMSEFVALMPAHATVLDWGCGTGRDSRAMLDRGFTVVSTDASQAMCSVAKELFGVDARLESFDELSAQGEYDGIWACASLLHVRRRDLPEAFQRAADALKPEGVLYASFKLGDFEGERGGRWYTDLDEGALAELSRQWFEPAKIWVTGDVRPGRAGEKWLNCLLRKRS